MGNKQAKNTNRMIDQNQQRLQSEGSQYKAINQPREDEQYNWAKGAQGDIYGGYKNMTDPKFLDQFGYGGLSGGGGGGYSAPTLQAANLKLDDRWKNLEEQDYSKLKEGAHSALTGYNEFANTGGWSDADKVNFRARTASMTPALYDALRNQMARASGGTPTGILSAASGRLARQGAQGLASAVGQGELDLGNQIRQGRMFGIQGQESLGGLGLAGMANVAGESQRIADFNEQERVNIANQNAQAAASAANANSAQQRALAEDRFRAYGMGLGGMMDIYTSSPGLYNDIANRNLEERNMTNNQIGSGLGLRASYNPNVSMWDRAMQGIGAGAGLAGAFF